MKGDSQTLSAQGTTMESVKASALIHQNNGGGFVLGSVVSRHLLGIQQRLSHRERNVSDDLKAWRSTTNKHATVDSAACILFRCAEDI